jgi:two-component system, OmpR family, sensor kinase
MPRWKDSAALRASSVEAGRRVGRGSARHVLGTLGAIAAVAVVSRLLDGGLSTDPKLVLAALLAAGCGAAAAFLAVFAVRAGAHQQVGWVGLGLGGYGLVAVPAATVAVLERAPAAVAVQLVADGIVLGLLTASLGRTRLSGGRVRLVTVGVAAAVVGATTWGTAFPAAVETVATTAPVAVGLALAWTVSGVLIALQAARLPMLGLRLIGTGIALLGAARLVEAAPVDGRLIVGALHALGLGAVALVLYGALDLSRRALEEVDDRRDSLEEELRLAEDRLARTAVRDHELRNGLAGLAGATTLLREGCSDPARLRAVVASELDRLDDLLQGPPAESGRRHSESYAVAPVVQGLAALRRSAGMDLRLELEPGLRAVGSSRTLAQVVTNLLANVDRHAPGSAVLVTAARRDGRVVLRVRDYGPGIAAGAWGAVFEPGVGDPAGGGRGLGLAVCRRLLAAEGGAITLVPPPGNEPGCVAVVDLPTAPVPRSLAAEQRTAS